MQRILVLVWLGLIATLTVSAAENEAKPRTKTPGPNQSDFIPTTEQILAKYVQAIGGKTALEKIKSRVLKASLQFPSINLTVNGEFFSKAPNKRLNIIEAPGGGTLNDGYNGSVGWSQNPQFGVIEKKGDDLAITKREADFYRDLKLKEIYPKMVFRGKQKIGAREGYIIEATPIDGNPEKFYFDTQSGLLLRHDSEFSTPAGKIAQEVYFEDHKDVDGVKVPFTIRRAVPAGAAFVLKVSEVKHNVPLPDAKFNKPLAH